MRQILSAAVTPFSDNDELDLASAARLYERGLRQGIDGFFIFGSMGEWALLTPEEKLELAELACSVIGSRAKLLVGISDTGLSSILRNAQRLQHLGHSHWTVLLPGGWAGPADPVKYVHTLANALDRPLFFYYLPGVNNVVLSPEQFRDILAHPRVAGVKNSAGSISVRKELLILKESVDFELYDGDEWAVDEALALGCDGVIAGFASTGGALMKRIAAQVESGNLEEASKLQYKLIDIYHNIYGSGVRWWCAGQKYALKYLGVLSSARTRVPAQQNLPEEHKALIRACIESNSEYLK